ncbi:flagellar export protein FliJ [Rheinheimera sp. 4Y26]|uniref:flagellar export protein FliJ n=1 Tax=Rheinheimera sp. 4Y26 TaxID=2977811 RepID=UPI0021B0DDDC|nr:flagellar export protein FliJ [Rheinheimera sp. 4Y26]MCT6700584.1 flagellar export protein FliJ [Rheinheimera sp. 4Y26]
MALPQLQLLAKVQREKEDKLQALYIQAQQFAKNQQDKYDGLANYRTDYIRQSQQRGMQGVQSRQFNQYLAFITKLDQALEQQNMQVQQAKKVAETRRVNWILMQRKRKAIDLLIEKELEKMAIKAQKQEQKMLDEIATQQFFRNLHSEAG